MKSTRSEHGVQELIDRLYVEGVAKAQAEADTIVEEAKARARTIVSEAKAEAKAIKDETHKRIHTLEESTKNAFKIAIRDAILEVKGQLILQFQEHLHQLIQTHLEEDSFLEEVLKKIFEQALVCEKRIDINLDEQIGSKEQIANFTKQELSRMLQKGVRLGSMKRKGIHIKIVDENLLIDLSQQNLASLIYQMVESQYHTLLEGIQFNES